MCVLIFDVDYSPYVSDSYSISYSIANIHIAIILSPINLFTFMGIGAVIVALAHMVGMAALVT